MANLNASGFDSLQAAINVAFDKWVEEGMTSDTTRYDLGSQDQDHRYPFDGFDAEVEAAMNKAEDESAEREMDKFSPSPNCYCCWSSEGCEGCLPS